MKCPQCGVEVQEGAKFCGECGFRLKDSSKSFTGQPTLMPASPKPQVPGEFSFTDQKTLDSIKVTTQEDKLAKSGYELIERYDILEEIGRGGMGVVYKAQDRKLGRVVAVKRLLTSATEDRLGIERFLKEAQTVAGLNHRNIVTIHDIGQDSQGHFIIMEFVDGKVLTYYIREKGKLDVTETIEITNGIGSGLSYAHKRSIVHRDIKPGNIILDKERVPKILDFGLAKMPSQTQLSMSGYGMGTLDYAAPEQKRDAKNVDHRSDIYSLGAVMYEMLTGEVPRTIRSDRIPENIVTIVLRCLEEKPENRYFSIDELLTDCEKAGKGGVKKKPSVEEEPEGTCPECSTLNKPDAKFCRKCGIGLFEKCAACDKEIRIKSTFCEFCGINVPAFKEAQEQRKKGEDFLKDSQYGRAAKAYQRVLELFPKDKDAKALLAEANKKADECKKLLEDAAGFEKAEEYEKAGDCYERYLKLKPKDGEVRAKAQKIPGLISCRDYKKSMSQAETHEKAGKLEKAFEFYEKALACIPGDQAAKSKVTELKERIREREYKESMQKARKAEENQDFEEAQSHYTEALKHKPKDKTAQQMCDLIPGKIQERDYQKTLAAGIEAENEDRLTDARDIYEIPAD